MMKRRILLFCLAVANTFMAFAQNVGQLTEGGKNCTVVFKENFSHKTSSVEKLNLPMAKIADRVKPRSAEIIIKGNDIPDEVRKCAEYAATIWEGTINNCISFQIEINWGDFADDITTSVIYLKKDGIYYPRALVDILNPNPEEASTASGVIDINKNSNWDFAVEGNIDPNKNNLTFTLLRSICRIMGFGSSAHAKDNGNYDFFPREACTNFDLMVRSSNGIKFSDIPRMPFEDNAALAEFFSDDRTEYFLSDGTDEIQLAGGPFSPTTPPLGSLPDGLMKKTIYPGDLCLRIEDNIWKALRMVEWNIPDTGMEWLVCDDADESGIVDAYDSHRYRLKAFGRPDRQVWKFTVPVKGKGYVEIPVEDHGAYCIIPPCGDESDYERTVDGLIRCRLSYSFLNNGVWHEVPSCNVFWETAPEISDITVKSIEFSENGLSMRANYEVKYSGSPQVTVYTKEEFSGVVVTDILHEPSIAAGKTSWVFREGYSWITAKVSNAHGETERTIEIEPDGTGWGPTASPVRSRISENDPTNIKRVEGESSGNEFTPVRAFDLQGNTVWMNTGCPELPTSDLRKGIYLIECRNPKGETKSIRINIK